VQIHCALAAYHTAAGRAERDRATRGDHFSRAAGLLSAARQMQYDEQLPILGLGQLALARARTPAAGPPALPGTARMQATRLRRRSSSTHARCAAAWSADGRRRGQREGGADACNMAAVPASCIGSTACGWQGNMDAAKRDLESDLKSVAAAPAPCSQNSAHGRQGDMEAARRDFEKAAGMRSNGRTNISALLALANLRFRQARARPRPRPARAPPRPRAQRRLPRARARRPCPVFAPRRQRWRARLALAPGSARRCRARAARAPRRGRAQHAAGAREAGACLGCPPRRALVRPRGRWPRGALTRAGAQGAYAEALAGYARALRAHPGAPAEVRPAPAPAPASSPARPPRAATDPGLCARWRHFKPVHGCPRAEQRRERQVRLGLAACHFRLGRLPAARAAFRRALALAPGSAEALLGLAVIALAGPDPERCAQGHL